MKNKLKIGLAAAVVVAAGGAGIAAATTGDGEGTPITGTALQQASKAALDHVGQGHVTGTEVGDEESYYQVEVTKDDGSQVDVQLDEQFHIVSDKVDSENDGG